MAYSKIRYILIYLSLIFLCINAKSQKLLDPPGASTLHNVNCVITIDNNYYKTIQSGINANTGNCVVVIPASYTGSDAYTNPNNVVIIDYRNKQIKISSFLTLPANGLNATALPVFGASGTYHSVGAVPDPGSTAGNTRFLREDGSWSTVNNASSANQLSSTPTSCTLPDVSVGINANGNSICAQLTQDDIAPAFGINSFCYLSNCGGSYTVEIGTTISNPVFNVTYTSTPNSASISNTDNINSPLNLSSPFSSVTVTGSFLHSTASTTTFQISAEGASTRTINFNFNWWPCIYSGVGSAGATSAITVSGTTCSNSSVTLSTGDVLTNNGLSLSQVGTTFGPYNANNQVFYLLIIGGGHTLFQDTTTGFAFVFNSPIAANLTNVNGDVVPMYLYSSSYTQLGNHTVLVQN